MAPHYFITEKMSKSLDVFFRHSGNPSRGCCNREKQEAERTKEIKWNRKLVAAADSIIAGA
jgi:hypothetical protein